MEQKVMNGRNAPDIAERKKKKKKKKKGRRKDGVAIVLNHTDPQRMFKKRKRSTGAQKGELPSPEAPSEKEKQSLRAWVERWIKPQCKINSMQALHGDTEVGGFVKRVSVDGSSSGHTYNLSVCVGNNLSGPFCNGDSHTATVDNGTCDLLPSTQTFDGDHGSHGYGEKPSSNGQNCQANRHTQRCSARAFNVQSSHEVFAHAVSEDSKKSHLSEHVNVCCQERGQSSLALSGEVSVACHTSTTHAHHGSLCKASGRGKSECSCLAIAKVAYEGGLSSEDVRSGKDHSSCQTVDVEISHSSSLLKANDGVSLSNSANPFNNKRKRKDDKVLQYVLKRNIVIHPSLSKPLPKRSRTAKSVVDAWGRSIPVTLTSEACTVEEWVCSQKGNLFGLDVEWRPNRARGEKNKVALLQLCNESECLIIQMLFLNHKPQALCKLLADPSKSLAGVGVLADGKRLLHDYGLECQGSIELTTLAVERLKRDELKNVGLKVLMQEVLGLQMHKPKRVTLSNWAKVELDAAQINYACMDAWASFALSQKLLADM